jgi:hypothetical protein
MNADYIPTEFNTNYARLLHSAVYNMKSGPPRSGCGPNERIILGPSSKGETARGSVTKQIKERRKQDGRIPEHWSLSH